MKSILLAYLLWMVGGFFGLHKFYLGRPFMGLFYFFTGGGFVLGWLYDFFTLPRQVQTANAFAHYHREQPLTALRQELENLKRVLYTRLAGKPGTAPPAWRTMLQDKIQPQFTDKELMLQLLQAAQKHHGRLSVTQGVIDTGAPFADVERVLQQMVQSNYVYIDNDPATGVLVFIFKELF
ncbi:MAG: TM2 domain-containing protein [Candidatus Tectimicrobiota bacterium]